MARRGTSRELPVAVADRRRWRSGSRSPRRGGAAVRLAVVVAALLLGPAPGEAAARQFRRLGLEDGLSHLAVYSILQDGQGFLWFGTQGGLDRYDGYRVLRGGLRPGQPRLLPGVDLGAVYQDAAGALWVGTWGGGLHRWEPRTGALHSYRHDPQDPRSLSDDRIHALAEDGRGALWVGTVRGLDRIDLASLALDRWSAGNDLGLREARIWSLAPLADGRLWVGTSAGLLLVDPARGGADVFRHDPAAPGSLPHDQVRALLVDRAERLWVGTQEGLAVLPAGARELTRLPVDANDPTALGDGTVNVLFEDSVGRIWVGTQRSGLHRLLDPATPRGFERLRHDAADPRSLPHDDVRCLAEDSSGQLWVGTRGGGVAVFDPRPPRFGRELAELVEAIHVDREEVLWAGTLDGLVRTAPGGERDRFVHRPGDAASLPHDIVQAVVEDRRGTLWVGTYAGLVTLDRGTGAFTAPPGAPTAVVAQTVESLLETRDGSLWVGTRFAGLFRRGADGVWSHFGRARDGRGLSDDYIRALHEGTDGSLWIGTDVGGLDRLWPDGRVERFLHRADDAGSLSDNRVHALWEDLAGALWIGTAYGLNRLREPAVAAPRFEAFFEDDGLPSATILGILGDGAGNLWLSSHGGLSRVGPGAGTGRLAVQTYGESDGLQGPIFTAGAAFRTPTGELLFGGRHGLNRFFPERLRVNNHRPPVVLTDVQVFGQRPDLGRPVTALDRLDLSYRDTFFTLELAALDFVDPQRNRFRYKLEGFDPDWVDAGNRRWAAYTRVDPGDYVLRVEAANSDGVWSERQFILPVHVAPPWWGTTWFRALAALLVAATLLGGHQARLLTVRRRNVELERLVAERTREAVARRREAEGQRRRLALINDVVKLINQETEFPELLRAILEGVIFFEAAERGIALVTDADGGFQILASSSWMDSPAPTGITLSRADVERDYLAGTREVAPGIFLGKPGPSRLTDVEESHGGLSAAILALRIEVHGEAAGYLVLSHRKDPHAFAALELDALQELIEHLVAAFFKGRALERLRLASEQKSLFLGIAAHDLRSPLGGILSTTDLLLRLLAEGRVEPELWRRFLGNVRMTAEQMRALVSDLLDVTAIETGRVKVEARPEPMRGLLEEWTPLHQRLAEEKEIELAVEAPPADLTVLADRSRVGEILDNLLSNAVKFTGRGGQVRVWCRRNGKEAEVFVADSGQGLTAAELPQVFEGGKLSARPTAGESSSGLGLVIVRKLVELHGGRVWVESRAGEGATFAFSLPLA